MKRLTLIFTVLIIPVVMLMQTGMPVYSPASRMQEEQADIKLPADKQSDKPLSDNQQADYPQADYQTAEIDEQVIYDENGIIVTALSLSTYSSVWLYLLVENNTEDDITVYTADESVNGITINYASFYLFTEAGRKAQDSIWLENFRPYRLADVGVTEVYEIELKLNIIIHNSSYDVISTDNISIKTSLYGGVQSYDESGNVIFDAGAIRILEKQLEFTFQGPVVWLYIENLSLYDISVDIHSLSVNSLPIKWTRHIIEVLAGKRAYVSFPLWWIDDEDLFNEEVVNLTDINDVEVSFMIYDRRQDKNPADALYITDKILLSYNQPIIFPEMFEFEEYSLFDNQGIADLISFDVDFGVNGIVLIVINIAFLICHISVKYIANRRSVMTQKTANIFNNALVSLLGIYILLNYLLLFDIIRANAFDPLMSTVFTAATVYLLFSPFFWVSSVHLTGRLLFYTAINKRTKFAGNIKYFRDELSAVEPGLLSLVYDFRPGDSNDIAAVLLKLLLGGYIEKDSGVLRTTSKYPGGLPESEKLVYYAVGSGLFDIKKYEETVVQEAQERKLISGANETKSKKILMIAAVCMVPFLAVAVLLTAAVYINSNFYQYWQNGRVYVEVDEQTFDEYDNIYRQDEYYIEDFQTGIMRDFSNPTVLYDRFNDKYYARADLLGGIYKLIGNRDVLLTLYGFTLFLSVFAVIVAISSLISQIKCLKYNYRRTPAGYKLINEAIGLKNFLKDFSVIGKRDVTELPLWEYYMIYAVVLDVNTGIEDEVISAFADSLRLA